jgi:uracil-DNA glycosylase
VGEPFSSLASDYPGEETYPAEDFRVEWGPIFHRGRLDGSAKVLVIGQDPGQHESVARRILVGEAGQRTQGFLHKLGIERSYVMVNAFLYSVYGQQAGERHIEDEEIARYRHRWLDALLLGSGLEAVISLGHLGREAFERWRESVDGGAAQLHFEHLTHPTMPEASSGGDPDRRARAMRRMLEQWNEALERLAQQLTQRDADRPLEPYGEDLLPEDRVPIPADDLPPGAPPWWSSLEQWAERKGVGRFDDRPAEIEAKRATIVVTVPRDERPWHDD